MAKGVTDDIFYGRSFNRFCNGYSSLFGIVWDMEDMVNLRNFIVACLLLLGIGCAWEYYYDTYERKNIIVAIEGEYPQHSQNVKQWIGRKPVFKENETHYQIEDGDFIVWIPMNHRWVLSNEPFKRVWNHRRICFIDEDRGR